jgi:hypothetical protein
MEQDGPIGFVKTPHPKLIYFAARNPRFSPSEFIVRWRQHARLGMSMPRWRNIKRYIHCDQIVGPYLGVAEIQCDGVAMVWYHSESTRQAHIADTSAAPILKADELETFERPVRDVALLTDEVICIPSGEKPFSLFLRVCNAGQKTDSAFLMEWDQDFLRPLSNELDATGTGFIHNTKSKRADPTNPYCHCIAEFQTEDPTAIADTVRDAIAINRDVARISAVWTRNTTLHDV